MRHRTVIVLLAMISLLVTPGTASADQPVVTSMFPTSSEAHGGVLTVISGSGFAQGATVRFGGVLSTEVTVAGTNAVIALVPPGPAGSSQSVIVTNPDGLSVVVPTLFTYSGAALTATSMTPATGNAAGGTLVTIHGAGFAAGATVSFGGALGSAVTVIDSTKLTTVAPSGVAGSSVTVTVQNLTGGAVTVPGSYTFALNGVTTTSGMQPSIAYLSPNSGSAAGGTQVTIHGSGFSAGLSVLVGGIPATNVSYLGASQVTFTTPSGPVGPATVTVTNPTGVFGGVTNGFTYLVATPQVVSIFPAEGLPAGGTQVSISGSGFVVGATVLIGGQAAREVSVTSGTLITAITPPGIPGAATVLVTNPGGLISGLSGGFTYSSTASTVPPSGTGIGVTSVSPASGPVGTPTIVTISGHGFVSGAIVTIGGVPATNVNVISPTQILATVPTSPAAGAALVVVSNAGGAGAALPGGFTYTSGTTPPPSGSTSTFPPGSSGLFVFSGGTNQALVSATGCPAGRLVLWATNAQGQWVGYIPGAPAVINGTWDALFPTGIPAGTAVYVKCSS